MPSPYASQLLNATLTPTPSSPPPRQNLNHRHQLTDPVRTFEAQHTTHHNDSSASKCDTLPNPVEGELKKPSMITKTSTMLEKQHMWSRPGS